MTKFVRVTYRTIFLLILCLILIAYVLIVTPMLQARDRSIRDNAHAALSLEKGKNIIYETDTAIILWDEYGTVFSVSPQASRELGIPSDQLEGGKVEDWLYFSGSYHYIESRPDLDLWVQEKDGRGGLVVIRPKKEDPKEQEIQFLREQLDKAQQPLFAWPR